MVAGPTFVIEGRAPLRGAVTPGGNKNAAFPLIAAALLTDEPVRLRNLPDIADVRPMLKWMWTQPRFFAALGSHSDVAIVGKVYGPWSVAYQMVGIESFLMDGVDINDNVLGQPNNLFIEDAIEESANPLAGEQCDTDGESATCDTNCSIAFCALARNAVPQPSSRSRQPSPSPVSPSTSSSAK
mgnify:CR=1 FL=1